MSLQTPWWKDRRYNVRARLRPRWFVTRRSVCCKASDGLCGDLDFLRHSRGCSCPRSARLCLTILSTCVVCNAAGRAARFAHEAAKNTQRPHRAGGPTRGAGFCPARPCPSRMACPFPSLGQFAGYTRKSPTAGRHDRHVSHNRRPFFYTFASGSRGMHSWGDQGYVPRAQLARQEVRRGKDNFRRFRPPCFQTHLLHPPVRQPD